MLSSTAISESSSSPYKESSDSTAANLQVQPSFIVPEKNPVIQWKEEKCDLSAQTNTKPSDVLVAREDDCRADATLDESSIILIQSTIRGYLVGLCTLCYFLLCSYKRAHQVMLPFLCVSRPKECS